MRTNAIGQRLPRLCPGQQRRVGRLRRLEPAEVAAPAHRLDLAPGARARHPRSLGARAGLSPEHAGHLLDPGARLLPRRVQRGQRQRHPPDAAHPGDRQHPRRDPRAAQHVAPAQRRLVRHARQHGDGGGRRGGPVEPLAALGSRDRELREDRPQDQDHPAHRRVGRGPPRRRRDDLRPRDQRTAGDPRHHRLHRARRDDDAHRQGRAHGRHRRPGARQGPAQRHEDPAPRRHPASSALSSGPPRTSSRRTTSSSC